MTIIHTQTHLDIAHANMQATPENDSLRLRFLERLGDAELFLLLTEPALDDHVSPHVFETGSGTIVLVFDREDRLTEFIDGPAPYLSLSGRAIATLCAEQNLGLGLNLGIAPSSFLLDAEGVAWLANTLSQQPQEVHQNVSSIAAPARLPEVLITALDTKLAMAQGLAQSAYLVATHYDGDKRGHMLAFVGVLPGAQGALAQAVSEAVIFSGLEAGILDVGFFDARDPFVSKLTKVGLQYELPQFTPATNQRSGPGMDPNKPPKLL